MYSRCNIVLLIYLAEISLAGSLMGSINYTLTLALLSISVSILGEIPEVLTDLLRELHKLTGLF